MWSVAFFSPGLPRPPVPPSTFRRCRVRSPLSPVSRAPIHRRRAHARSPTRTPTRLAQIHMRHFRPPFRPRLPHTAHQLTPQLAPIYLRLIAADGSGVIDGGKAVRFFGQSGVPNAALSGIWKKATRGTGSIRDAAAFTEALR
jgi:hypothetical protein